MSKLATFAGREVTYDYDTAQDMLYILFEPVADLTYYEDVPGMPDVMLRYDASGENVVGVTVHHVASKLTTDEAIRRFADDLLKQLQP